MKDKQTFLMKGSFALLLFVILGYMVKFYPETLVGFDQSIQTAIRGDLPDYLTILYYLTILFRSLTHLIDIPVIITWVVIIAFVFYRKRWKIESFFMLGNLALAGLLIVTFKNIYQRPRPAILHLVEEKGFSFPSGHSLAVTLMVGTLIVILSQRIKDQVWRKIVQIVLGLYLVSVLVSRVYLGVHYPSDVLASFCVGLGVLFIEFPFYDKLRFQWRFKGKQK
ncbi:TPA: phosphatase PAP2 family protein [Streptococcus pneumoniae]